MAMFLSFSPFLVELRGGHHLLTSQHSLPGIPVALKQCIDLRTSMDGKYKEIAEVSPSQNTNLNTLVMYYHMALIYV